MRSSEQRAAQAVEAINWRPSQVEPISAGHSHCTYLLHATCCQQTCPSALHSTSLMNIGLILDNCSTRLLDQSLHREDVSLGNLHGLLKLDKVK